jgi:hypothetical protein
MITVLRAENTINGGTGVGGKLTKFLNPYESTNVLINSSLLFDVNVDSAEQRYRHTADVLPSIQTSKFYTPSVFNDPLGGGTILAIKLSAAPTEFSDQLLSGTATRNLNTDIAIQMTLNEVPTSPLVATTFMLSSVLIHSDGTSRGDLRIKF